MLLPLLYLYALSNFNFLRQDSLAQNRCSTLPPQTNISEFQRKWEFRLSLFDNRCTSRTRGRFHKVGLFVLQILEKMGNLQEYTMLIDLT